MTSSVSPQSSAYRPYDQVDEMRVITDQLTRETVRRYLTEQGVSAELINQLVNGQDE